MVPQDSRFPGGVLLPESGSGPDSCRYAFISHRWDGSFKSISRALRYVMETAGPGKCEKPIDAAYVCTLSNNQQVMGLGKLSYVQNLHERLSKKTNDTADATPNS